LLGWLQGAKALVIWVLLTSIIVLYLLLVNDDVSHPTYKRSRGMIPKLWSKITSWIGKAVRPLEDLICSWKTNSKAANKTYSRSHTTRSYRHRDIPWSRGKKTTKLAAKAAAYTVLVCSTSRELQANVCSFDTDSLPLRVDNCTSKTMSNKVEDFVGPFKDVNQKVKGIGGTVLDGIKEATFKLNIEDDQGRVHQILIPGSLYVPKGRVRLLSPQHWAQTAKDNKPKPRGTYCGTYDDCIELWWDQRQYTRTVPLDQYGTNTGTIHTAPGYDRFANFCEQCGQAAEDQYNPLSCEVEEVGDEENEMEFFDNYDFEGEDKALGMSDDQGNPDLMEPEDEEVPFEDPIDIPAPLRDKPLVTNFDLQPESKQETVPVVTDDEEEHFDNVKAEFLRWHHRLGHLSPERIQKIAEIGLLPRRLAKCEVPLCTSCLYGKATRRPWRTKASEQASNRIPAVHAPGDCVSVDQLQSTTPGLIAQLRGKPTLKRYTAATIFVDQYSGLGFVWMQKDTTADETVQAKSSWERYAADHGVKVKHYHADNGRFADHVFMKAVAHCGQTISFCGVNAHFQNGVAEKRIRDLKDTARTMLIHANRRWPEAITTNLWPYALRMTNAIYNQTPTRKPNRWIRGSDTRSPLELFANTPVAGNPRHWHTFGCPVYVLDNAMQAAHKIGAWEERTRIGLYLGQSPNHARSVGLILNITTGLVSPQFHIKWDDGFQTVRPSLGGRSPASQWQYKCGFLLDTDKQPKGSEPSKLTAKKRVLPQEGVSQLSKQTVNQSVLPQEGVLPQVEVDNSTKDLSDRTNGTKRRLQQPDSQSENRAAKSSSKRAKSNLSPSTPSVSVVRTRAGRESIPPKRLTETYEALEASYPAFVPFEALADHIKNVDVELIHPKLAYAASADPDTMYLHEAMREPDAAQFEEAMLKEVNDHSNKKHWRLLPRKKVPQGTPVVPSVWAMRRKRRIDTQEVYKWKARLNFDGRKQIKGVNYWETYSPVATWESIRFVLIQSLIEGFQMRQIDFVQAYTQAKPECDMYMKVPKGFQVRKGGRGKPSLEICRHSKGDDDYALKLEANLYGSKQAGRVWNRFLAKKLTNECGFTQSQVDECVFYRGHNIFVLYTDDSLLTGPKAKELDNIITSIRQAKLDITVEDDVSDFLGVKIERKADGTFHLTQPHLIDSILKDLRLDGPDTNPKHTPGKIYQRLFRHLESDDFDEHFIYRRVIGKLNYLEKSTRPDISCQVHMCARFCENPKREHGEAVKWLGRYLAGTRDKGLILSPKNQSFDCYVDADFAGNWDQATADWDPDTAKSRTGFVVMYAGCPVVWTSRLQTQIVLSSTEAEYAAMSEAMRTVTPLMDLAEEMARMGFNMSITKPKIHCRLFEDNAGAIEIAKVPKMRSRTKYMNCRYHHFRNEVETGRVTIQPIQSSLQPADYLTKSLDQHTFELHRRFIQGW